MKGKFKLWFLIMILLLMSSCTKDSKEVISSLDKSYSVETQIIAKGDITIKYPQIIFIKPNTGQKSINEMIKEEAGKVMRYYDNSAEGLNLEIDYQIQRQDEEMLSIQYAGVGYVEGAAHPNNLFYTTNINLQEEKLIRLKNVVEINRDFVEKQKAGEFKMAESAGATKEEILSYLNMYTTEERIERFKNADSLDNIGTDKQSDIFSYFTADFIGISVGVSHATGDHAEFLLGDKD
ncbi:PdaC/SigV domain-containing protein [Paenibacillus ihuae]|uniref:PdaC/SigV domain-containing protein n=1 Tax=Paenibacillus ihuae TaxID=1232431 RepID=UPI0006D5644A|nr:DUF4163 domain-containing protein [Paenibacillus ihuae]